MLEGFLFGIGLWGSLLAVSLAIALICFIILFVSYLVNGRKNEEDGQSNIISGDDLWGRK